MGTSNAATSSLGDVGKTADELEKTGFVSAVLDGCDRRQVARWFNDAIDIALLAADGSLAAARIAADARARRTQADNTRRAYRAAVCAWCA